MFAESRVHMPARAVCQIAFACGVLTACGGGGASRIEIISGGQQAAQAGTQLPEPVRFRVVDEGGNGVAGVFVRSIIIGQAGGIMKEISGAPQARILDTTDVLGEGEFYWLLGGPLGEQLASSTVVDHLALEVETIESVLIRAQAQLGSPEIFTPHSGYLGSAEVGATADSLVVSVLDMASNPIPGVEVSWVVTAGGGTLSDSISTTDSLGLAWTRLTVGPAVGDNRVEATAAGLGPVELSVFGMNTVVDAFADTVAGSGGVPPDLVAYGAAIIDNVVAFHMRFAEDARSSAEGGPNQVRGFIEVDVDQDQQTGGGAIVDDRPGGTLTGMGVEYRILLQLQGGMHQVTSQPSGATVYWATAMFSGRTVTVRVPFGVFGGDDGNMDYAILVGTPLAELGILAQTHPTDWAPESGAAVITP